MKKEPGKRSAPHTVEDLVISLRANAVHATNYYVGHMEDSYLIEKLVEARSQAVTPQFKKPAAWAKLFIDVVLKNADTNSSTAVY